MLPYSSPLLPSVRHPSCCLVAALPLLGALVGGVGHAQALQVSLGGAYGTDGRASLSPAVTILNATIVAGFGVNARVTADLGARNALDGSLLAVLPVGPSTSSWNVYAGPGVSLTFGRPALLRPSVTAGLSNELNGQTQLFAEVSAVWQGPLLGRAGFTYSF